MLLTMIIVISITNINLDDLVTIVVINVFCKISVGITEIRMIAMIVMSNIDCWYYHACRLKPVLLFS